MTPNETNQSDGGEGAPLYPKPASIPTSEAEADMHRAIQTLRDMAGIPSYGETACRLLGSLADVFYSRLAPLRAELALYRRYWAEGQDNLHRAGAELATLKDEAEQHRMGPMAGKLAEVQMEAHRLRIELSQATERIKELEKERDARPPVTIAEHAKFVGQGAAWMEIANLFNDQMCPSNKSYTQYVKDRITAARTELEGKRKALAHYAHADFLTTEQQSTAQAALK